MKSDYKYRYQGKSSKKVVYGIGIVAVAVIVFAIAFAKMQFPEMVTTTTTIMPTTTTTTAPATGTLMVAVKDANQKLSGLGQATSLILTIDSIQVHKTGTNETDENVTAEGWITIFSGSKTFDLLDYTDVRAVLGQKDLEPGKYTQVRLYINSASINITNTDMYIKNKRYQMTVAANGNLEVPSNVLKLTNPFTIDQGKATVLTLDFDVPNSVTRAGTGYFLKPTIKITEETLEEGQTPANSVAV
jgi:hypothetical protein